MIFIPKLDVCMGNAYVKFELNRVYMVLSARLFSEECLSVTKCPQSAIPSKCAIFALL